MILVVAFFRLHLSLYGVTVHVIEPGAFQTNTVTSENFRRAIQRGWDSSSLSTKEEFGREYLDNCKFFYIFLFIYSELIFDGN